MSKAEEFEGLTKTLEKAVNFPVDVAASKAGKAIGNAQYELGAFAIHNRDLIARALRRDAEIEKPTILEALAAGPLNTAQAERALKDPEQLRLVLAAFREAVK